MCVCAVTVQRVFCWYHHRAAISIWRWSSSHTQLHYTWTLLFVFSLHFFLWLDIFFCLSRHFNFQFGVISMSMHTASEGKKHIATHALAHFIQNKHQTHLTLRAYSTIIAQQNEIYISYKQKRKRRKKTSVLFVWLYTQWFIYLEFRFACGIY